MKKIVIPLFLLAFTAMSFNVYFKKTKVLFFGDSITQARVGPGGYPGNAEKGILTTDRVHLNDAGNLFVANEMW